MSRCFPKCNTPFKVMHPVNMLSIFTVILCIMWIKQNSLSYWFQIFKRCVRNIHVGLKGSLSSDTKVQVTMGFIVKFSLQKPSSSLPHVFFLRVFLMFQLFNPHLQSRDPIGFKHECLAEILGQDAVNHVLYLMQLEGHNDVKLVQLLLLLKLEKKVSLT